MQLQAGSNLVAQVVLILLSCGLASGLILLAKIMQWLHSSLLKPLLLHA